MIFCFFVTILVSFLLDLFFSSTVNFYFRRLNSSLLLLIVLVYGKSYIFIIFVVYSSVLYITWLFGIHSMCYV